jgi:hypothetical protein
VHGAARHEGSAGGTGGNAEGKAGSEKSNPEIQKKVFGPKWEHEIEKQGWPFWKRLMH